jgi:anti-sigma-K factor RskA
VLDAEIVTELDDRLARRVPAHVRRRGRLVEAEQGQPVSHRRQVWAHASAGRSTVIAPAAARLAVALAGIGLDQIRLVATPRRHAPGEEP